MPNVLFHLWGLRLCHLHSKRSALKAGREGGRGKEERRGGHKEGRERGRQGGREEGGKEDTLPYISLTSTGLDFSRTEDGTSVGLSLHERTAQQWASILLYIFPQ